MSINRYGWEDFPVHHRIPMHHHRMSSFSESNLNSPMEESCFDSELLNYGASMLPPYEDGSGSCFCQSNYPQSQYYDNSMEYDCEQPYGNNYPECGGYAPQRHSLFSDIMNIGLGLLFGYGLGSSLSGANKASAPANYSQAPLPPVNTPSAPQVYAPVPATSASLPTVPGAGTSPAPANTVSSDNMGKQFENWGENIAAGKAVNDFSFVGSDYEQAVKAKDTKKASGLYKTGITKFAQDSIKKADKNNDGKISYQEYLQDEQSADNDETKRSFQAIDLNHDGFIETDEEASVYAAMDQNPTTGDLNGKISKDTFTGVSASFSSPESTATVGKKFNTMHQFLFGS